MSANAILLISCPDRQGIITDVTRFITENRGNIVYIDQYVDNAAGVFFMRLEWELEGFLIPREKISDYVDNPSNSLKEEKSMDMNELRAKYPDLVNQIADEARQTAQTENAEAVKNAVNEAVIAERKRLQDIDSIAQTIGADLVNEAKYGENPMSASELALKALQNQQAQGADFLKSRNEEQKDAEVNAVVPQPVSGTEEDSQAKDIADGAALLNAAIK